MAKWSDYPYVVAYGRLREWPASLIDSKVVEAGAADANWDVVYRDPSAGWVTVDEISSVELEAELRERVRANAQST
jgi:hypothetical protein